ncbi:hypothetical protein GQ43DRAFT_446354 [Delitschia confertaspora ATCC 74209]|uniref:Asl1-like glycosyl hydrolase catalytic domain-containing protein n=1 Tax=Delitschia confertaspora ATCC 74209 TaxID=1513339 RepID=A0A9P4JV52_9PLEO|nr:hypothetical protein GQ43DRAFT_446354 [Delitschia confertaspora ATCC 74209]
MLPLLPLPILLLSCLTTATTSPKRGLIHIPSSNHPSDDQFWTAPSSSLTWYYNYGFVPSPSLSRSHLSFVPMLWGASDDDRETPFLDSVKQQLNHGAEIEHVLSFNEPDGDHATGGSDIEPSLAAKSWKAQISPLRDLGVKVGAPAVTGSSRGLQWLDDFFSECNGECDFDFMPVHWYGNFEGLASHVGQVMERWPGKGVWVTEFGNITHYSYFGSFRSSVSNIGPNAAMLTKYGKLTDIGSWYLGGPGTGNVPQSAGVKMYVEVVWWKMLLCLGIWFWMLL